MEWKNTMRKFYLLFEFFEVMSSTLFPENNIRVINLKVPLIESIASL